VNDPHAPLSYELPRSSLDDLNFTTYGGIIRYGSQHSLRQTRFYAIARHSALAHSLNIISYSTAIVRLVPAGSNSFRSADLLQATQSHYPRRRFHFLPIKRPSRCKTLEKVVLVYGLGITSGMASLTCASSNRPTETDYQTGMESFLFAFGAR